MTATHDVKPMRFHGPGATGILLHGAVEYTVQIWGPRPADGASPAREGWRVSVTGIDTTAVHDDGDEDIVGTGFATVDSAGELWPALAADWIGPELPRRVGVLHGAVRAVVEAAVGS